MLRPIFRAAFEPFAGRDPMAAELVFGILAGIVLALSFWLFADRAAIRALRKRLWSHVLEVRLFGDEPALAFGTLVRTLKTNVLLLGHALPPLVLAAPVVALAAFHLSDFFARTPLAAGADAVLTVRLRGPVDPLPPVELHTPPWIDVDAPPVHILAEREVSWRLRATGPNLGLCYISLPGETVSKELDARPGPRYSGTVRAAGWAEALLDPAESRLPDGPVERIWISQLPAPLIWAGVTMDWWEWFAGIAAFAAWVFSIPLARRPGPRLLHLLFHRLQLAVA
jgi:hypothetical protein